MVRDDDSLLKTEELKAEVAQTAAKGAAALALAKPIKGVVSLLCVATLARLLTPLDFGLVAMVAVVTRFIDVFRDAGLSTATIQREALTGQQLNAVFWINIWISGGLALLLVLGAPGVAWFYDEPRLVAVTAALGAGVLLSGGSIQHRALLRRRMRFQSIVVIELVAFTVASVAAIAMALSGAGYWALVARTLIEAVVLGILMWSWSGWTPGVPRLAPDVGSLVRFGANLTGFNLLNFLSRNADNLLVGKLFGAAPLGMYQKAYDLMMLSTKEVMRPAGGVAISALSRLVSEPERYRRAYFRIVDKLLLVTTPFAALMLAAPDWLVAVLLGDQWQEAVPLVRIFGVTAMLQPLSATMGWLLMTQDRTAGLLRLGVLTAAFNLLLFGIGALWGVVGIAVSYSVGQLLRTPLALSYGAKEGPVRQRDLYICQLTFVSAGAVATAALHFGRSALPDPGPFLGAVLAGFVSCAVTWGALLLLPRGREALADVPRGARLLAQRRRS